MRAFIKSVTTISTAVAIGLASLVFPTPSAEAYCVNPTQPAGDYYAAWQADGSLLVQLVRGWDVDNMGVRRLRVFVNGRFYTDFVGGQWSGTIWRGTGVVAFYVPDVDRCGYIIGYRLIWQVTV